MNDVSPTPQTMIADLSGLGEMRVWSVLITIFGDAVVARGGSAPSVVLRSILDPLGIKPEAMRVALHRLVKDGWISREKAGRESHYRLSEKGVAEFLTATKRIYAKAPALKDPWKLVVLPQGADTQRADVASDLVAKGFVQLNSTTLLGHSDTPAAEAPALAVSGTIDRLPGWARTALAPEALESDYVDLEAVLSRLANTRVDDPEDATALRILLVHQWRRVLLRHADLPDAWMPEGWRGEACRSLVLEQHARLSELADPWLDSVLSVEQSAKV